MLVLKRCCTWHPPTNVRLYDSTLTGITTKLWARRVPDLLTNWHSQPNTRSQCPLFLISKLLSAARVRGILTNSLKTTIAIVLVIEEVTLVLCPPATS